MKGRVRGRAWKFGNDLSMDRDIFPFRYLLELSKGIPLKEIATRLMEPVDPEFGKKVRKGDFLVAGRNFGFGKAHSEGVAAMKALGLSAIIVDSAAPRFLKNALYYGLAVLVREGISGKIEHGHELDVDPEVGTVKNLSTGKVFQAKPAFPPGHPLYPIMKAGGQMEYIKEEVARLKKMKMIPDVQNDQGKQ